MDQGECQDNIYNNFNYLVEFKLNVDCMIPVGVVLV
jgi:hypothetical protein